jgi:hypothetical protein
MAQPKIAVANEIKIDKGIPVTPHGNCGVLGKSKYPFREMAVGDSFFAPLGGAQRSSLSRMATGWTKDTGFKFVTRKATEGGQEGVRIWRVG